VRLFRKNKQEATKISLTGFEKKISNNIAAMKKKNNQMA